MTTSNTEPEMLAYEDPDDNTTIIQGEHIQTVIISPGQTIRSHLIILKEDAPVYTSEVLIKYLDKKHKLIKSMRAIGVEMSGMFKLTVAAGTNNVLLHYADPDIQDIVGAIGYTFSNGYSNYYFFPLDKDGKAIPIDMKD